MYQDWAFQKSGNPKHDETYTLVEWRGTRVAPAEPCLYPFPMSKFDVVGFDGDDTLWENERLFVDAQAVLRRLVAGSGDPARIDQRLIEAEKNNLAHFGYGIKGFALSMIETAIELTGGKISGNDIKVIVDTAKSMLAADVVLLDHVAETLAALAGPYRLILVTKGDLHDQERKVARSGLAHFFSAVEIVSEKAPDTYRTLLKRHAVPSNRFLMVGNSLRSDILPVLEIGGSAVHIPHELTWSHEYADPPATGYPGYHTLDHIGRFPELLRDLEQVSAGPLVMEPGSY
jgi:putative hydrolase of the HAD superfamily